MLNDELDALDLRQQFRRLETAELDDCPAIARNIFTRMESCSADLVGTLVMPDCDNRSAIDSISEFLALTDACVIPVVKETILLLLRVLEVILVISTSSEHATTAPDILDAVMSYSLRLYNLLVDLMCTAFFGNGLLDQSGSPPESSLPAFSQCLECLLLLLPPLRSGSAPTKAEMHSGLFLESVVRVSQFLLSDVDNLLDTSLCSVFWNCVHARRELSTHQKLFAVFSHIIAWRSWDDGIHQTSELGRPGSSLQFLKKLISTTAYNPPFEQLLGCLKNSKEQRLAKGFERDLLDFLLCAKVLLGSSFDKAGDDLGNPHLGALLSSFEALLLSHYVETRDWTLLTELFDQVLNGTQANVRSDEMEYLVSLGGLYASVLRRDFFINEQADHDPILASSPRGLPQRTSSLQSLFRSSELIFKREATCSAQSHDTSLSRCFQRLARQWTSALSSVFSDPRSWRSIPELLSLAVPDETLSKHPETEQVSHVAGFCEEVLVEVAKSVQSYRENFELGRRPVTSFGGPPSITSLMETERKMRSAPGDIAGTVRRADPAFRQFVATHLSNTLTRLQSQRLRTSGTPSSLFDTAHNTFQPLLRFAIQLAHAPTPFPPRQGELSVYARPTAVLSAAAALGSLPLPPPPPPPPLSARRTGLVSPRKRALLSPIPLPEQLSPQRQQLLRAESPLPLGLAANPGGGSTVFQSVVAGAKRGAAR